MTSINLYNINLLYTTLSAPNVMHWMHQMQRTGCTKYNASNLTVYLRHFRPSNIPKRLNISLADENDTDTKLTSAV